MNIEHVTISIAKTKDNKYLIIRSPKWKRWVFPGGHIEQGENLEDAAARELLEETGVKGNSPKYLMSGEIINSPDFHRPAHFKYEVVLFETDNTKIKIDKREVLSAEWKSLDELKDLDVIAPEHYKLIFAKLEENENLQ